MVKLLFMLFIGLMLISCHPSIVTHTLNKRMDKNGIYYALPKTSLGIKVSFRQIHKNKGEFSNCDDQISELGIPESEVIRHDEIKLNIEDAIVSSSLIPDLSHIYMIEINKKKIDKDGFNFKLTDSGMLLGINDKVSTLPRKSYSEKERKEYHVLKYQKKNISKKCDTNEANKAVKYIGDLRSNINRYLTGANQNFNTRKDTLEYVLNIHRKNELKALNRFRGHISYVSWEPVFNYIPTNKSGDEKILLSILSNSCVILASGYMNIPIPESMRVCDKSLKSKMTKVIQAKVFVPSGGFAEKVEKYKYLGDSEESVGIRYRIPAKSTVHVKQFISDNEEILFVSENKIAQFGTIVSLPGNVVPTSFYSETGSIRSVE